MSLKDHCHCEHAKESHHDGKYNCLAAHCDCEKYQVYTDPYVEDPTPTQRIWPAAKPVDDLDTWPIFPAAPKWPF